MGMFKALDLGRGVACGGTLMRNSPSTTLFSRISQYGWSSTPLDVYRWVLILRTPITSSLALNIFLSVSDTELHVVCFKLSPGLSTL